MLGKLGLSAFQHGPIETGASISMALAAIFVIGTLTYLKRWSWIWNEWITSLDPKKIGVMYIVVALVMLFKGVTDAGMIRAQQFLAVDPSTGFLSSHHFQQIVTAHGTIMIFFVGMGIIFGLMNLIVPLQIGARDVAFPFMNSLSFWLFVMGALLVNVSLAIGEFSAAGWVGYPPLSGIKYSPEVGVDYWIWALQISGIGSLMSGINFLVTILTMRCPGMTLTKMPIFAWSVIGSVVLIIFAFPILTATLFMLSLDRLMDMHFFTPDYGGNPMMYINLIWAWGHPEVYILILPIFGVFSEVVPVFSKKRLFSYISMVWAIGAITFLSFIVWVHHFFTMGAGAKVNAFFGIMTMLIAVPTGVKIFNWLFTMFRGRVRYATPMLWFLGFIVMFTLGGMTGVLLSIAPVDFQVHNSLFLIAHFHSVIIGGVVFGFFSAFTYWFPKFMGFSLVETWGRRAFWCWFVGFAAAFLPLYLLGFMGATRRLDHYSASTGWHPLFALVLIGFLLIICGVVLQVIQVLVSIKHRHQLRDTSGDPWDGRTLEWSTSSPPPLYNFATIPTVECRDAFWEYKIGRCKELFLPSALHQEIYMPKNSASGLYIATAAFFAGFCLIWHIFVGTLVATFLLLSFLIHRLSQDKTEELITTSHTARS